MNYEDQIKNRFQLIRQFFNEKQVRVLAAAEARVIGRGGISIVSKATGISRPTIYQGMKDLKSDIIDWSQIRRSGGGRKRAMDQNASILFELEVLLEPDLHDDPRSPLRWTCKGLRQLSNELKARGYSVSYPIVGQILKSIGYRIHSNARLSEGKDHPDRQAQFEFLNRSVKKCLTDRIPVVFIHWNKIKENPVIEMQPPDRWNEKSIRWMNAEYDHHTMRFAVNGLATWWQRWGIVLFPKTETLLVCVHGDGTDSYRVRFWKSELQSCAKMIGRKIMICHFPHGTTRWSSAKHCMDIVIEMSGGSNELKTRHEISFDLILSDETPAHALNMMMMERHLDDPKLELLPVPDDLSEIHPHEFYGDWNYSISPF